MGTIRSIFALAFLISSLASASPASLEQRATERLNAAAILSNQSLDRAAKIKGLLAVADALFTDYSFNYADEVLREVLKLDPQNAEARVLEAIIRPFLPLKGLQYRMKDYNATLSPESQEEAAKNWAKVPRNSARYLFWWDQSSGPQIQTEADFQKIIRDMNVEAQKTRKTLKELRSSTFSMTLRRKVKDSDCMVTKVSDLVYVKPYCRGEVAQPISFDKPDMEFLLFYANILDLYTVVTDAYQLDGTMQITAMHTFKNVPNTDQNLVEFLKSIPEFGMLKSTNQLRRALEIGPDIISTLRFLTVEGDNICKSRPIGGDGDDRNQMRNDKRFKTSMFLSDSFCMFMDFSQYDENAWDARRILTAFENMLNNRPLAYNYVKKIGDKKVGQYPLVVDIGSFFVRPVPDLKPVMPDKFNVCGDVINYADPTIAGIFPRGDANKFYTFTGAFSLTCRPRY